MCKECGVYNILDKKIIEAKLMPMVSVIIPAYNGVSRYLDRAIQSVLEQTCRDVEIIVVDDASTDETDQLVARYAVRYHRRTENGRQAVARNDGARLAKGEFLAFLDQDDLWEPTFLQETMAAASARTDAAAIHTDGVQVTEQNEALYYDGAMKQTASITQLLRGGHDVATSGCLFRKACFNLVHGYDERLSIWEDIDLAIRLYQRFPIVHLPKPLYRHRLYDHNASRGIESERALESRRYFLEKHSVACRPDTPEGKALKRDWAHYYRDAGKYYIGSGHKAEARAAFWRSLKQFPFNHKTILRLIGSCLPG